MKIKFAMLITLSAYICACAPSYKPVLTKEEYKDFITKVKVISIVDQSEIVGQHPSANITAAGVANFGIAGLIIGTAIDFGWNEASAQRSNARVTNHQQALAAYDAREKIHSELIRNLKSANFVVTEFIKDPDDKVSNYIGNLSDEKVIVVRTRYSVDPTLNFMHVIADAKLYLFAEPAEPGSTQLDYFTESWRIHYQTPRQRITYLLPNPETRENVTAEIIQTFEKLIADAHRAKRLRLIEERERLLNLAKNGAYIEHPAPPKRFEIKAEVLSKHLNRAFEEVANVIFQVPFLNIDKQEFDRNRTHIQYADILKFSEPKYVAHVNLIDEEPGYATYLLSSGDIYILPKNETAQLVIE